MEGVSLPDSLLKKGHLLRCTLRSLVRRMPIIRLRGRLRAPCICHLFEQTTSQGGFQRSADRQPLEVAVAVIQKEGRLLIAQRLPGDSFGGFWEFPGGKTQPGESLEQCLAREIQEELGIKISVGSLLQVVEHATPNRTIRLHCFSCGILSGELQAIECATFQWVSPPELDRFTFPPASGPLLDVIARLNQSHKCHNRSC